MTALWGYVFVPIKVVLAELPPFALVALRFLLAAVPMVFFVRPPTMPWPAVAGYGIAIGVFQFGVMFVGMNLGVSAGLASLVVQLQVFFTIGLAVAFAGERLARHHLVGAVIAATGVVVLAGHKLAQGASGSLAGLLLVVEGALAWAIGNIIAKRGAGDHGADMFALVVWSSLAPVPLLAAISYAFEGGPAAWQAVTALSAKGWGCVLLMAWGATLFGYGTWNVLLHRYPTALIQPFALLVPVSGLASGALFLGETLSPVQAAGVLLVFAGLAVNVYGPRIKAWLA